MLFKTRTIGYPVIGANREWKRTLETFWRKELTENEFLAEMKQHEGVVYQAQKELDIKTVGDFSFYDRMLDWSVAFGVVPERFAEENNILTRYYSMSRGNADSVACSMRKWWDTNYHYIVPEITKDTSFQWNASGTLRFQNAQSESDVVTVISPYTYLKLAKGSADDFYDHLQEATVAFGDLLGDIIEAGYKWVVIEDPSLLFITEDKEWEKVTQMYQTFAAQHKELHIFVQTYFSKNYAEQLFALPVAGVGITAYDLSVTEATQLQKVAATYKGVIGLGVVNGRNVWKQSITKAAEQVAWLTNGWQAKEVWLQPNCSLLHVPVTVQGEQHLPQDVQNRLAFAEEKLVELGAIKQTLQQGIEVGTVETLFTQNTEQEKANRVPERAVSFAERYEKQMKHLGLGAFPTTSIGSFPQSDEVRKQRLAWRKGNLSDGEYDVFLRQETKRWVDIQEELDLDVLVHGEFERTDMVEYFGEQLGGFYFSKNGWVQSYGSRCVKPPIIADDVVWSRPMTVEMSAYAQSL
ncbi:MAG: 5-methyltetrahydropteroyltriglutamate--homocysteine S-methyltransferase, partial [Bacilli bacterium]